MGRKVVDIQKKFLSKFKKTSVDDCWIWTGAKNKANYGHFYLTSLKRTVAAHRVSYVFFKYKTFDVELIQNDNLICHKCDNPPCVNPNHLFEGTAKDNVQDMINKKRRFDTSKENNGKSKLTFEEVKEIRNIYSKRSLSQLELGKKFGVAQSIVSEIVRNINWVDKSFDGIFANKKPVKRVKIDKELAEKIEKDYKNGISQCKMVEKYNVSQAQVSRVLLRQIKIEGWE